MRCALIGCGPMGAAAARELAAQPADGLRLVLVDRDAQRAHGLAAALAALPHAGRPLAVDVQVGDVGAEPVRSVVAGCAVLATALSWADARPAAALAVQRGLRLVGIGRPPDDPRAELDAPARAGGARIVVGVGLEPGLTEILARRLAAGFDEGAELRLYCGGVPRVPRAPFRHVAWYGSRLTISPRPAYVVRDGALRRTARFGEVELVRVPGLGVLEAFHDGMVPWLREDAVLRRAALIAQKTLRWPGFAARVRLFDELGLLGEAPLATADGAVRPRALLDAVLEPHVARRAGDEDVTVLALEAAGTRGGSPLRRSTALIARTDPGSGVTGMGRLTGGVLAQAVQLLAADAARGAAATLAPGVIYAHELFAGAPAEALLERLRASGVAVTDRDRGWVRRRRRAYAR